ncbi:hypothetical protein ABKV19_012815 [Rosa sericea]
MRISISYHKCTPLIDLWCECQIKTPNIRLVSLHQSRCTLQIFLHFCIHTLYCLFEYHRLVFVDYSVVHAESLFVLMQDHCLIDLLHQWQDGKLPVDIACVISNHERGPNTGVCRFLERHGIPYHYLHTTEENKREEEILELVQDTDFLVLARYMQILSGNFLNSYGKDVINIHHGLLPSFKGGRPSKQAFDAGVKLIGATTHFVTQELDAGPIIEQMVARVSHRDNLQSFVQKSENLEKQCLSRSIKSYCELRVLPYEDNKTVVF